LINKGLCILIEGIKSFFADFESTG
jgi:hypothetical protein